MSRTSIEVPLAKTVNDDNEFAVKFTGMYVTAQELMIIAVVTVMSYPLSAMLFGSAGLMSLLVMLISAWATSVVINNARKGRPPSYIWDIRYRVGFIPEQRCWMKCSMRRPRVLLRYHKCIPHVFLGGKAAKDLLSVDQEWRRLMPPGGVGERPILEWPRLAMARRRLVIESDPGVEERVRPDFTSEQDQRRWETTLRPIEGGFPAPIWFYAPLGFDSSANHLGHDKVLHITLPMQRSLSQSDPAR